MGSLATRKELNWLARKEWIATLGAYVTLATHHLITTPQCIPLGPNMVKCHVVDIHMTPLREWQHTYHQNIKHILSSHHYLQHDFSRDLKNESKKSQTIKMLKIRGVLSSIMDLNI